jgi:hypothetical protein
LAAWKGIIGEGLGMDGSRPCHVAKKEGDGEGGGVLNGLFGLVDALVDAA